MFGKEVLASLHLNIKRKLQNTNRGETAPESGSMKGIPHPPAPWGITPNFSVIEWP